MQEFVFKCKFVNNGVNVLFDIHELPVEFASLVNSYIMESILNIRESVPYNEFVKSVQNDIRQKYCVEVSVQHIMARVAVLQNKNKIEKYVAGYGKCKQLYIRPVWE